MGKAKTLDMDDRAFYLVSILSIVDSLLLVDPRVRRDDLLRAQEDSFLALRSAADAADEQHGQDPDHAEKNTNPASYHRQMSLGLSVKSTLRRK